MLRRDLLKGFVAMSAAGSVAGGSAASLVAQQVPLVKIDGSSTVFPTTEAAAEKFQKVRKSAVRVMVGISGTSGGFKKFCRGDTDISNASRPILKEEMEGLQQEWHQVHRAAGELRRSDRGREPEERLG